MPNLRQIKLIKAALFITALVPLFRLIYLGVGNELGANPVEFVERSTGTWALAILMVTLSFTPIRLLTGAAWLLQFRRMAGLFMFFYAVLHITTYIWLDHWFDWAEIVKDVVKHPYVLVGFTAFLLSVPLAMTSNDIALRVLKQRWKKLHMLVYPIALLGVVHFWWLVKKDIREPLAYALVLAVLLGVRFYYKSRAVKLAKATAKVSA